MNHKVKFDVVYDIAIIIILVSVNCASDSNRSELAGLADISERYIESFGFDATLQTKCYSPSQLSRVYLKNNDCISFRENPKHDTVRIIMLDGSLYSNKYYSKFCQTPPDNIKNTLGTIFFKNDLVLMQFNVKSDLNSPTLTHELMHYVLYNKGFSEDVYINQVHEDWKNYLPEYKSKNKEWLWSYITHKKYYIFG